MPARTPRPSLKAVYTPAHLRHDPQVEIETSSVHPPYEHVARAESIRSALAADGSIELVTPTSWGLDPIRAVHDPGLVGFLATAWAEYQEQNGPVREVVPDTFYKPALRNKMSPGREPAHINARLGWWSWETVTPLTEGTYDAARAAVDTALTATRHVLDGDPVAYGLCRPPGHHATTSMYGGYCFFNNAAIAAHHVATSTGVKVSVLDVDYHHGNGTQEIFYDRGDVQYVSLHADPVRAYPYSVGFADETGTGAGAGSNLNIPLPPHVEDGAYLGQLTRALDAIDAFGPALVVVSLGLDTFVTDPICDLSLTTAGFHGCGSAVRALGSPMVVLQEGGYDVAALGRNAQAWLRGAAGLPDAAVAPTAG